MSNDDRDTVTTRLLEFEEPSYRDGWREWTVVEMLDGTVFFRRDYLSPHEGERDTWNDVGFSVSVERIDEVIAALLRAKVEATKGAA